MNINIIDFIHIIILIILVISAYVSIIYRNLLSAVIGLGAFSLILSVEFFLLHAPDVAIAEAGVGAALSTAIYIFAVKSTKKMEEQDEI